MARLSKKSQNVESQSAELQNVKSQSAEISNIPSLAEELEQLKKKIAELERKNLELSKPVVGTGNASSGDDDDLDDINNIDISSDRYVKVISLCPNKLNLHTKAPKYGGKKYTFEYFGQTKRITYHDLVDIMEFNNKFLEEGFFYIASNKVIRKHGLDDVYSKILTKEKIEGILAGGVGGEDIISLFKSATSSQQQFIVDMIVHKLLLGQEMDLNFVTKMSTVSKIDIVGRVKDAKDFADSNTKK